MVKIKLFTSFVILLSLGHNGYASNELCCDLETGIAKPFFKNQLAIVGIEPQACFVDYAEDHVLNLNKLLQNNGCFQRDFDVYKKGQSSDFTLTFEQAENFLNDDYGRRKDIMPRYSPGEIKEEVDAIIPGGVIPTLYKRINTLKTAMERGYSFRKLFFSFADPMQDSLAIVKENSKYRQVFEVQHEVLVSKTNLDIFEANLKAIKEQGTLARNYVIITDSILAGKSEEIAKSVLGEDYSCQGIVSIPLRDWREDMALYGYPEALGNHEDAAIAWASSAWNFIARQIHTEARAFVRANKLDEAAYLKN